MPQKPLAHAVFAQARVVLAAAPPAVCSTASNSIGKALHIAQLPIQMQQIVIVSYIRTPAAQRPHCSGGTASRRQHRAHQSSLIRLQEAQLPSQAGASDCGFAAAATGAAAAAAVDPFFARTRDTTIMGCCCWCCCCRMSWCWCCAKAEIMGEGCFVP